MIQEIRSFPTAALLIIGTELVEGKIQDTHARLLCSLLTGYGIRVTEVHIVPDDANVSEMLRRMVPGSDLIITSGGLGPTSDDVTREAIAGAAGTELALSREIERGLMERFGPSMPSSNLRQAYFPTGFEILENPFGTAPGFTGLVDRATVVALPGPPSELRGMVDLHMDRLLTSLFGRRQPEELLLSTFLIPESKVEDLLEECRTDSVQWGTRAEDFRITVKIRGGTAAGRDAVAECLSSRLGPLCCVSGEHQPHELLLDLLTEQSKTLVAAESCTGGLIAKLLTDLPGASRAVWGSFVTYANEAKVSLLGVPARIIERCGAVSAETVTEMCRGALDRSGADIAIAVSGIAGPDGGTPDKPVGTVWIGVSGGSGSVVRRFVFGGGRDRIRRRSAAAALLLAWGLLKGFDVDKNTGWAYI